MFFEKKSNGKFKNCCIHDVLRDLCVRRARDESFLHIMDGKDDYLHTKGTRNIIRRLSIHRTCIPSELDEFFSQIDPILLSCSDTINFDEFERNVDLLSVWVFGFHCDAKKSKSSLERLISSLGSSFKLLRVLDASKVKFSSFPIEVLELSRLRYLAISRWSNREFIIPPCISKLENLEILIIYSYEGFGRVCFLGEIEISFGILKMPHLRHLIASKLQLSSPIPFACASENLQTLSRVVDFRFSNRAVQMIPNLKKLKILYKDGNNAIWERYCLNNLVRLCELEMLNFYFCTPFVENLSFPENFAFPQNLKKLSLEGCKFPWKQMTVVGSLSNLQVLKLRVDAFVGDEWESIEEEFTQLKFLLLENVDLKHWRAEETQFPRLEELKIGSCRVLEEIPLEIGNISTLKLIEVYSSSKSAKDSALQIQEEQKELGNDVLEVLA